MDQINALLRQQFAELLEREVELPTGVLVTCKKVVTSRDLSDAKVWISVLPSERTDEALALLKTALPELQHLIAGRIRLQHMPRLTLVEDQSEERAGHINEVLDQLKQDESGSPLDTIPEKK
ncbi:MAG: 30S ribosome-binding factor RbfA [Candidatus Kerfeldbacteria bacterium]|nr:30S ribosome-binding factor RbfA [Candidatus Kerfeldbacteria bacterium]